MDLVEKYRPTTFEAVIGQSDAIMTCRALVREGPRSLVLGGPSGTGKTAISRVYAAAIQCEEVLAAASPCGSCESCEAVLGGTGTMGFRVWNSADLDNEAVDEIVGQTRSRGFFDHRVLFFDEAHQLRPKSVDMLLTVITDRPWNIFIFASSEAHELPRTLRSRCRELQLRPVDAPTAVAHLRKICDEESILAQPAALELIAHQADGSVRLLLEHLESCVANNAVSMQVARRRFGLEVYDRLSAMLLACIDDDLASARQQLDELAGDPPERRKQIHDALVAIFEHDILQLRR